MTLHLTDHAISRYHERYRPHLTREDAASEFAVLVAHASPTRKLTIARDARVWVAAICGGERIALAVRDSVVITVLPPNSEESGPVDMAPDDDLVAESEDTRSACLAMLGNEGRAEIEAREARNAEALERQRKSAQRTVDLHAEGQLVSPRTLKRARRLLGYGRQA